MKTLKFYGFELQVTDEELDQDVMDIDFGGAMMVRFSKNEIGEFEPTNAMNGWGDNCYQEIMNEKVTIEEWEQ